MPDCPNVVADRSHLLVRHRLAGAVSGLAGPHVLDVVDSTRPRSGTAPQQGRKTPEDAWCAPEGPTDDDEQVPRRPDAVIVRG